MSRRNNRPRQRNAPPAADRERNPPSFRPVPQPQPTRRNKPFLIFATLLLVAWIAFLAVLAVLARQS